jgi:hypothetical protein
MESIEEKKGNNWFVFVILLCFLVVIFVCFYFFYFKKDFSFIIEVPCDRNTEECLIRDCSYFECPPNNLSVFKRYSIKANDFESCPDENCEELCITGEIKCGLIACEPDLEFGESCVFPIGGINNLDSNE